VVGHPAQEFEGSDFRIKELRSGLIVEAAGERLCLWRKELVVHSGSMFITLIFPWGFDFGGSIFHVSFLSVVSLEDHRKHQVQLFTLYIREFA
jgi:hypothetical protein